MWLKNLRLTNIKSFADSGNVELSKGINLLVGANNAGKSTILRAISLLQPPENTHGREQAFFQESIRVGAEQAEIEIVLQEPDHKQLKAVKPDWDFRTWTPIVKFASKKSNHAVIISMLAPNGNFTGVSSPICHQREPYNFIYPYFSRRKPTNYTEQINLQNAGSVEESFQHLPSKIDRLSNPDFPHYEAFREVCRKALGFAISSGQWGRGKQPGLVLEDMTFLPVDSMGEGTINILAFISHIAVASGKLFLIEEIENDIHPKALKALLDFVAEKSKTNQFIISTHSNIVVTHLATVDHTKLFSIDMELAKPSRIPTSSCHFISDSSADRIQLLENLGYEPFDFYLWKGYLILEESTAERIIRDFLIPHCFPKLQGKLKTLAARGVDDVEKCFHDFRRMFVFVHSTSVYKERAWVAVDAGERGRKVVSDLQTSFQKDWSKEHFRCFREENFEAYYPEKFKEAVSEALSMKNGPERQTAKKKLVEDVLEWALANPKAAEESFKTRAADVFHLLQAIEQKLET